MKKPSPTIIIFTARQQAVIELLCGGECDKVISDRLKISPSGVRVHLRAIFRKLNARNRAHAAALFTKQSCF